MRRVSEGFGGSVQTLFNPQVILIIDIADHCNLERSGEQVNNHNAVGPALHAGKPPCAADEAEVRFIHTRRTLRRV